MAVKSSPGIGGLLAITGAIASTMASLPATAQLPVVEQLLDGQVADSANVALTLEDALPGAEKLEPVEVKQGCATPALERQQLHTVAQGDTLATISSRYGVTIATLKGLNPVVRDASAVPGQLLQIPPYDGVQVETKGQSWSALSKRYSVPAATLFEQNGCADPGVTAFIPGVQWQAEEMEVRQNMPVATAAGVTVAGAAVKPEHRAVLDSYPLVESTTSLVQYGWQLANTLQQATFHSGVDLRASVGDGVFSVGDGTVAFAGAQKDYGNLVVVNHARGLQTRYAHLIEVNVVQGQVIEQDTLLGLVGQTGVPSAPNSHLHFEVRLNSRVGWVAQDPNAYFADRIGARLGLIKLAVSALSPI